MLTNIELSNLHASQEKRSEDLPMPNNLSSVFPSVFPNAIQFANPGPTGLFGFGLTTVLLNVANAGYFEINSMVLGMGLVYGGAIQFIAGLLEFVRGNTFGFTAFCSYGGFWMSFVFLKIAPQYFAIHSPSPAFMGWYLCLWGVFSFFMFLATFRKTPALRVIFGTVVVLFWLLAIADWSGSDVILKIAGWEGIVCGCTAMYMAAAEVLHDSYRTKILPY